MNGLALSPEFEIVVVPLTLLVPKAGIQGILAEMNEPRNFGVRAAFIGIPINLPLLLQLSVGIQAASVINSRDSFFEPRDNCLHILDGTMTIGTFTPDNSCRRGRYNRSIDDNSLFLHAFQITTDVHFTPNLQHFVAKFTVSTVCILSVVDSLWVLRRVGP